jgi:hypothetical protein
VAALEIVPLDRPQIDPFGSNHAQPLHSQGYRKRRPISSRGHNERLPEGVRDLRNFGSAGA